MENNMHSDQITVGEMIEFLGEPQIQSIVKKYTTNKKNNTPPTFNIFNVISELYYRENLHSDIMCYLLKTDNEENDHNEGDLFLRTFLRLLKLNKPLINLGDYKNAICTREKDRIDVLIKDEHSHKAIIIENKINNAVDQNRQLARYDNILEDQEYEVDAIVYLTLDGKKEPDYSNWGNEEINEIKNKIIILAAFDHTEKDLIQGWLKLCKSEIKNWDVLFFINHYIDIIKKLAENSMNYDLMDELYKSLKLTGTYSIASKVNELMSGIDEYFAAKIKDNIAAKNIEPFKQSFIWKNEYNKTKNTVFVLKGFKWGIPESTFSLDFYFENPKCTVWFYDIGDTDPRSGTLLKLLKAIDMEDEFKIADDNSGWYGREFDFVSSETMLYDFVNKLLDKLKNLK